MGALVTSNGTNDRLYLTHDTGTGLTALRILPRVTTVLALFALVGCAFQAPAYSWHRPGGSSPPPEQDLAVLKADEDACVQERNSSSLRMFYGALWYDVTQRTIYKDCMEARGWTKEEQR